MEFSSLNRFNEGSKSGHGRRKVYGDGRRKNMKTVRLGGDSPQRSWRIKAVPKLRLKVVLSSPLRLLRKLKNGYLNMMLNLGSGGGSSTFGGKRIPKTRQATGGYANTTEFDNRLVFEIYKSLVASRELASN